MAKRRVRLETRYRELAAHLERAVRDGTYAPGARLPSVRVLCRDWNASITTVVAAYALLAQRGLVDARPQSGHFARAVAPPEEPHMQRPSPSPTGVGLAQLALMVMKDSQDPRLVPFGPVMPDPALLPSAELHRILVALGRSGGAGIDRYGIPPGSRDLRVAIARRATGHGCAVGPDDLITTSGALEALTLALRATCSHGDTVAIESPMYYGLLQTIESLGLRVVEVPSHPRDGMSLEALREALDEFQIGAVVAMPTGSNPLGSRLDDEGKRELVDLLARRGIPLIEDDVFGDLSHDGTRPRPAKGFDRGGGVLWCSSVSKTAAPGLRVGWIAAGRYQAKVEHLQFTASVGPSPLNQAVVADLLASGGYERCLRRLRPAYGERTAAMAAAVLDAFPAGTRVARPAVGFALWVELPQGIDAQDLYAAALASQIAITPGPLFSAKLRYRHFIRLNAAQWRNGWKDHLRRLGALARSLDRG